MLSLGHVATIRPRLILIAAALLTLCACGGNSASTLESSALPPSAPAVQAATSNGFGLPAPGSLPRTASFTDADRFKEGREFDSGLVLGAQNVSAEGLSPEATFDPDFSGSPATPAGLAYALYGFSLEDYSSDITLRLELENSAAVAGNVYVGLSNWDRNRWEFYRPDAAGMVSTSRSAEFIDEESQLIPHVMYCVVLVVGSDPVVLNWLRVGGNLAPFIATQPTSTTGEAPLTVDFDLSASYDRDGSIVSYELDVEADGIVEYTNGEGFPLLSHTYESPGVYNALLRVTDNDASISTEEIEINVEEPVGGGPPGPAQNLQASDGTEPSGVELNWDAPASGPAPDGYSIRRADLEEGPYFEIDAVGAVLTYTDFDVTAGQTYWYQLVSKLSGQPDSAPSNSNSGFSGLFPPNGVAASDSTFDDFVRITWFDPVLGPTPDGIAIYRSDTENGSYAQVGSTNFGLETFDDVTATPGVTYWYTVASYKAAFPESDFSDPADSGTRNDAGGGGTLEPPTISFILGGPPGAGKTIVYSDPSDGPTPDSYDIYRSTSEFGSYTLVGNDPYASDNDYNDQPPGAGVYWYKMKSKKAGFPDSEFSNADSA